VWVEDQVDAELLEHHPAELVGTRDQVRPMLGVDIRGFGGGACMHVGVLLGQLDEVGRADRREQPGLAAEVLDRLVQGFFPAVEAREDGAAANAQSSAVQFIAELGRILRQEALRAELGPHVAGPGDFIQVLPPRNLLRILREPHSPRVGCNSQLQTGQVARAHWVSLR
jgi:hypothetical protein